jgi:hypothetical protein
MGVSAAWRWCPAAVDEPDCHGTRWIRAVLEAVDGGGYTFSSEGGYELAGGAAQPDAGVLAGGGYTLGGGAAVGDTHRLY